MKRSILSSLICGALALLAPSAFAQGATSTTHPPSSSASPQCPAGKCEGMWYHHRQHEMEFLTKALNLTPDQQTKIKAILEQRYSQLKALHEDTSLTPEHRKEKAKAIFKKSHDDIHMVLTPEQQHKMKQIRKQHMEKEESASHCSDPNCSSSMCPSPAPSPY